VSAPHSCCIYKSNTAHSTDICVKYTNLYISIHIALYTTNTTHSTDSGKCVAVRCSALQSMLQCAAVHCSALQCVAVRCSTLQCIAVRCSALQCVAVCCSALQCDAVCYSALQCVVVRCSALQCVAVSARRAALTVKIPGIAAPPQESSAAQVV